MRLNLIAGAGAGKSVQAADLYCFLRKKGFKIELSREYVKNWCYENKSVHGFHQNYIQAKQIYDEYRLLSTGKVEHIVSDSPVLIPALYAEYYKLPCAKQYYEISEEFDLRYKPYYFFIHRNDDFYSTEGRYQDFEECKKVDHFMLNRLMEYCGENKFKMKMIEHDQLESLKKHSLDALLKDF